MTKFKLKKKNQNVYPLYIKIFSKEFQDMSAAISIFTTWFQDKVKTSFLGKYFV